MGYWYETEEPGGFRGAPFAARAVGQRHHHRLQFLASDFKFAHALELHRLPGQVFLRRDSVGKYVKEESSWAGRVNTERDDIPDDGLHNKG